MSDLCIECRVSVSGRKHAITCDACERWQHRLCNTGISLADYRAAIKGEREIHFLCRDCCNSIPTLEPDGDQEPMDETMSTSVGDPVAESTFAFAADGLPLKRKANTEPMQRLVAYIDRQWFNHAVFDVPSWSVFQQSVRTNNDVEGWHHRLNSKAGMSGLGFYRLVPLLRREAVLMEMALRAGDLQRDTRGVYRRLETRLQDNWNRYLENELTTTQFLRACGSLYGVRSTTAPVTDE